MNTVPTISVVMPVYNGARYLREAIASIRWQTFTDWEMVCVDDGSTDETFQILNEFAATDSRIRVIRQENQGVVAARNQCLQHARADWIACLDCDDIALPHRLATQLKAVADRPELVALGSNMLNVDPAGMPIQRSRYALTHEAIEHGLLTGQGGTLGQPSVLMKRSAVEQVGRYRKQFEWIEDTDLWLRLAQIGKLANHSEVLTLYRQHDQSTCWKRRGLQRELMPKLLVEAHRARGLTPPSFTSEKTRRRKQSSAVGKWARQAARAGYFATAWKHWRHQVRAEPLSFLTCRVTAEMLLRGVVSLSKGTVQQPLDLPDWHRWDATSSTAQVRSADAA